MPIMKVYNFDNAPTYTKINKFLDTKVLVLLICSFLPDKESIALFQTEFSIYQYLDEYKLNNNYPYYTVIKILTNKNHPIVTKVRLHTPSEYFQFFTGYLLAEKIFYIHDVIDLAKKCYGIESQPTYIKEITDVYRILSKKIDHVSESEVIKSMFRENGVFIDKQFYLGIKEVKNITILNYCFSDFMKMKLTSVSYYDTCDGKYQNDSVQLLKITSLMYNIVYSNLKILYVRSLNWSDLIDLPELIELYIDIWIFNYNGEGKYHKLARSLKKLYIRDTQNISIFYFVNFINQLINLDNLELTIHLNVNETADNTLDLSKSHKLKVLCIHSDGININFPINLIKLTIHGSKEFIDELTFKFPESITELILNQNNAVLPHNYSKFCVSSHLKNLKILRLYNFVDKSIGIRDTLVELYLYQCYKIKLNFNKESVLTKLHFINTITKFYAADDFKEINLYPESLKELVIHSNRRPNIKLPENLTLLGYTVIEQKQSIIGRIKNLFGKKENHIDSYIKNKPHKVIDMPVDHYRFNNKLPDFDEILHLIEGLDSAECKFIL